MKILAYKDLILTYIRQDYKTNEYKALIEKIIYNENSIFLYSKKFIEFLAIEIDQSERSRELVRFNSFVTKIQNEHQDKRPIVRTPGNTNNFDDEFLTIISTIQDKVLISIACNQPSLEIQTQIPNIAVLSQQKKPNYHWLVVNLAILHPFTLSVDEIDFANDKQIDIFFDDLFSIPRKIGEVTIFDDYYNIDTHNKYAKIANHKDVYVYYCTENHYRYAKRPHPDRYGNFNDDKYNILKKIFPKLELKTKNKGSHARRIIFDGFIVNPDIDLDLLNKKDKKMWSVHIRFCEIRAKEIIRIRDNDYSKSNQS